MRASLIAVLAMLGWFATYVHLQSKVERQSETFEATDWLLGAAQRSERYWTDRAMFLQDKLGPLCKHEWPEHIDWQTEDYHYVEVICLVCYNVLGEMCGEATEDGSLLHKWIEQPGCVTWCEQCGESKKD
jgi:hypothetical protein